jgi:hypothetical protein
MAPLPIWCHLCWPISLWDIIVWSYQCNFDGAFSSCKPNFIFTVNEGPFIVMIISFFTLCIHDRVWSPDNTCCVNSTKHYKSLSYSLRPQDILTHLTPGAVIVPQRAYPSLLSYAIWHTLSPQCSRVTLDMQPTFDRFYCSIIFLTHRQEPCYLPNVSHWLHDLTHSLTFTEMLTDSVAAFLSRFLYRGK